MQKFFRVLGVLRAVAAWGIFVALLYFYFVAPWRAVVSDPTRLGWLLIVPTLFIAICSASELSLLTADKSEVNNIQKLQTANYTEPSLFKRAISSFLRSLTTDETFTNAVIVMANTILAISMTVGIGHCLRKVDAADTFTIFGITIILFLVGETIPKQVALRLKG